ncbi:MAG: hypothetical protein J6330_03350 [Clostridia bacterium]|nr:hypothetical protein [Clostridia bacterium]MBP5207474.1 hypothetical protein [Clostridia bacterium]
MRKTFFMILISLFCLSVFYGCDPVLPTENIVAVYEPNPLIQGSSADIEIIYPDTTGTPIVEWTDQKVEVINGNDIVEVSGLKITGLKPGKAVLKVEVKANCAYGGIVIDKPVFSTELEVEVEGS